MAVEAPRVRMCPFVYRLTAPAGLAEGADMLAGLRRDLGAWLGNHPRREDAIAVMNELVENAFVHGSEPGGQVGLSVERLDGDRLEVCVRDQGRTRSQAPLVTTPPGFAHGLRIVSALCEEFALVEADEGGMTAQAILAATPPPVIGAVIEPAVDIDALLDAYPDGDDIRTGDPIRALGLRDETADVLEKHNMLLIADLLKFLSSRRLTTLSRIGDGRESEIIGALQNAGFEIGYVTGAAAVAGVKAAAPPPEPGHTAGAIG